MRENTLLQLLQGFTPHDLMSQFKRKNIPDPKCAMCGHGTLNFLGNERQLFFFNLSTVLTDGLHDGDFGVAIAVCKKCSHMHFYSAETIADNIEV